MRGFLRGPIRHSSAVEKRHWELFLALRLFSLSKGYYLSGAADLKGGSFSKKYKESPGGLGGGIVSPFRDNLTAIGFSIPITQTVNVSGGGAALQNAINAAAAGTNLVIQDSLAYNPITIANVTNLTISVAPLQTPTITAGGGAGQRSITIGAGNSGLKISGLSLIGNGNGNSGLQQTEGIINGSSAATMASIDRVIIENCTFSELVPASGAPAIQFLGTDGTVHTNILIHKCTAIDCGSNPNTTAAGYGTFEVSGFSNVFMQNCKVARVAIARGSSNMRGFCFKSINVVVEDCLADDIGTGGSNENFKHHSEVIFGNAVGNSTVRNCVAHNAKRAYRVEQAGGTMTVTASVAHVDTLGICAGNTLVRQTAGTMIFRNNIIFGAGDGTAFDATVTEDHNDVFNMLANGKPLDPSDVTVNPAFSNAPLHDYRALAAAVAAAASDGGVLGIRYPGGEVIIWAGV